MRLFFVALLERGFSGFATTFPLVDLNLCGGPLLLVTLPSAVFFAKRPVSDMAILGFGVAAPPLPPPPPAPP
eukprot:CAMPEP_0171910822 /NCGR_PEP_ID=MMETSP0993-20121228/9736_1 /TAXON_ID=483369 /ORGANISM="non described non described, Strain CCMP2098" /LENGTH=71 /DNA_ID=CAMNT_0012544103 /DNA_START=244 /DNA_END=455 /DNA_ORIENTATION=+